MKDKVMFMLIGLIVGFWFLLRVIAAVIATCVEVADEYHKQHSER